MVDEKKIDKIEELKGKFETAQAAVLADYRGLNVQQITVLRRQLGEQDVEYRVVKNSLAQLASRETPFSGVSGLFTGPVSIAFSYEDHVAPARVMTAFAKEEPALEITGGVLQGKVLSVEEVRQLAKLPPKEQVMAMMLAGLKAPVSGLVGVLGGIMRNLIYTLKAIEEQKESKE